MGRSPSISFGDASDGLRVEHVKSRRLVRLVRWGAGRDQDDAVGLEVSDFCARLGITTDVLDMPPRYLLIADRGRSGGDHVVALFDRRDEARAEFVRFRRSEQGAAAWAEVVELTTGRGMRRVCWFSGARASTVDPQSEKRPRRNLRAPLRGRFGLPREV